MELHLCGEGEEKEVGCELPEERVAHRACCVVLLEYVRSFDGTNGRKQIPLNKNGRNDNVLDVYVCVCM